MKPKAKWYTSFQGNLAELHIGTTGFLQSSYNTFYNGLPQLSTFQIL